MQERFAEAFVGLKPSAIAYDGSLPAGECPDRPGRGRQKDSAMTCGDILKKLEANRETVRGFGVRRLGIFGSYARGEQREAGDMDFLVEFDDATLQNYLDLKDFLEQLFGCHVDLVFSDTIKPRLKPIIFNEVVYAEGL